MHRATGSEVRGTTDAEPRFRSFATSVAHRRCLAPLTTRGAALAQEERTVANFGDWQLGTYLKGLERTRPDLPMSFTALAERAEAVMPPEIWSYVTGGAGDEATQDANARAFSRYGLMPRMLVGAAERDLSVQVLGRQLPTPLMLAPVGVIGICGDDGHGDLATARAAAALGVPMIASTLSQDPMEDVVDALGDTPSWFQLYPPNDRELAESLLSRAEAAGFGAIVITLDTLTLGWRPRDLQIANFPQLKGLCLANYFSDPVFRSRLAVPPEQDVRAATDHWSAVFGNQRLTRDDLAWLQSSTTLPVLLKGICSPEDARRAVDSGVDGIYCSNHGGRQANGGLLAVDCLADVVEAAGGLPVVFDSGIRSGPDVVKALALGDGAQRGRDRPALRLRARRRWPGRNRARPALPAGRDRPDDGHRRLPRRREPDPRRAPRRSVAGRRSVSVPSCRFRPRPAPPSCRAAEAGWTRRGRMRIFACLPGSPSRQTLAELCRRPRAGRAPAPCSPRAEAPPPSERPVNTKGKGRDGPVPSVSALGQGRNGAKDQNVVGAAPPSTRMFCPVM